MLITCSVPFNHIFLWSEGRENLLCVTNLYCSLDSNGYDMMSADKEDERITEVLLKS